jgi:hypothetical protein
LINCHITLVYSNHPLKYYTPTPGFVALLVHQLVFLIELVENHLMIFLQLLIGFLD